MQIKRFLPSLTGGTADLLFYFTGLYRLILKEKPTTGCLILMYHSLSRELKKLGYRYANTEKIFQSHLKFIRSHQIEAISLYEAISRIKNQEKFQDLCVAITFDDGWRDNYEIGYNLLRYYNIPATIFLIPNLVGYPSFPPCLGNSVLSERRVNLPRVMLNWEEIDKMKKDGPEDSEYLFEFQNA
jgi:hypothetical protein